MVIMVLNFVEKKQRLEIFKRKGHSHVFALDLEFVESNSSFVLEIQT